ncbi:hypothetical protein CULT_30113 [[Clostridium] ultunense Esp]|nr:hypothetical protein CULT_30113 [[Clostridium] ultunense Esp]
MGDANNLPITGNLSVSYNGTTLTEGTDYSLSDLRSEDVNQKLSSFLLTLSKLPTGSGRLTVQYDDPNDSSAAVSVSYLLRIEITPYVQLTYLDGTDTKIFEDGTEIRSQSDIKTDGQSFQLHPKGG